MKKTIFIMVLVMSAMIVNAQVTPSDRTTPSSADTSSYSRPSTGVSVSAADLPTAIRDNVSKDYPGLLLKMHQVYQEKAVLITRLMLQKEPIMRLFFMIIPVNF